MSIDVVQQLKQLSAGVASVPSTPAAAESLYNAAAALLDDVNADEGAGQRADPTLLARCAHTEPKASEGLGLLTNLARTPGSLGCPPAWHTTVACSAMAALGRQLAALCDASGSMRIWRESAPASRQLEAACVALEVCGSIASRQALPCQDALQLGGAGRLIFRAGQAALAGRIAAWRRLGPNSDLAADAWHEAAHQAVHQLSAALRLMHTLACSCDQDSPGAEGMLAEFAHQVAAPEAVLPWLATAAEALLLLPQEAHHPGWQRAACLAHLAHPACAAACPQACSTCVLNGAATPTPLDGRMCIAGSLEVVGIYANVTCQLLDGDSPALQPLSAALGASRSTQQSVARMLLHVGLPCLQTAMLQHTGNDCSGGKELLDPAGAPNRALTCLARALSIHSIMPAGRRCLHQPGAAALVQQAADIVQALPVA
jgi:hypothetical protein